MTISSRLALAFVVVALIPLVVTSWFAYDQAQQRLYFQATEKLQQVLSNRAQRIDEILNDNRKRLERLTSRTQIAISLAACLNEPTPENRARLHRILADATEVHHRIRQLSVFDPEGRLVASSVADTPEQNRADWEPFRRGRQGANWDGVDLSADGEVVFVPSGPLVVADRIVGVLVAEVDAEALLDAVADHTDLGQTGEILLVRVLPQGGGVYIAPLRFEPDAAFRRTLAPDGPDTAAGLALSPEARFETEIADYRGATVLAASRRVGPPDWGMVVKMNVEEALADIDELRAIIASAILGSLIVVTLTSLVLARSVSRPIRRLTRVVQQVGGETPPAKGSLWRGDELRQLEEAFGRMTRNLASSQEVLRVERDRAQAYLDLAPVVFVALDRDGRVALLNRRGAEILGRPVEDVVGRNWFDEFVAEPRREEARAVHRSLMAGEAVPRSEHTIRTAAGEERIIAWHGTSMRDEAGRTSGVLSSGEDVTDSKRDEEARNRLAAIVEASDDAIVSTTVEGQITSWNRGAERLYGFPAAEVLGQPIAIIYPPELSDQANHFRDRLDRRESVEGVETIRLRKDGERIEVSTTVSAIRAKDGTIVALSSVSRNITEKKQAQRRFRMAVEASPSGMIMIDSDGRIVLANSQTERLFGYDRAELIGQPVEILVPPRFRERHPDFRRAFHTSPEARPMGAGRELYGLAKGGREFPVEIGLNPIDTPDGNFVLAAIVDIAERKRAEETRTRLAAIVESSSDAIVSTDLDGVITSWNRGAEAIYGHPAEDAVGRPVDFLSPPDGRAETDEILAKLARGESIEGLETVRVRRDGERIEVSLTVSPIRDPLGRLVAASIVSRDITERKLAERRFRLAVEAAPSGMVMVDGEGRIVLVNSQTERLFGYDRADLIGRRVEILVPERFRDRHPAFRTSFQSSPEARPMGVGRELFGLTREGREFPVEIGLNPIRTGEGTFVLAAIVDITERKRADETRNRLASIVESSHDAIFSTAVDGRITSWNRGAERIYGWAADEAVGRSIDLLVPADREGERDELLARLYRGESIEAFETSRVRKDGRRIDVALTVSPIRDPDGRLAAISTICRDITEKKLAELRFRLAVEASPSGMVMVDAHGGIVLVNSQTERLFGYDRSDLIGQPVEILIPDFQPSPEARPMGAGRDLNGLTRDGRGFPVEIGLNPIETPDGTFVLAAIVDIAERKRMEADLRRSNAELEEFASVASHDLQEPLRKISTFADLLASRYRGRIDEKADHYIRTIVDSAGRLRDLIHDLLTYSRVGRTELDREPTDLSAVLADVVADLHLEIEEKKAAVLEAGALPTVPYHPKLAYLLLKNLVSNAIKYHGQAPPRVEISAEETETEWVVRCRDNGIGIAREYLVKIFEPFQRLHTRREYPGTGIGLAVCRKIVERHGGRIWAESESGSGTTFVFTLPKVVPRTHLPPRERAAPTRT